LVSVHCGSGVSGMDRGELDMTWLSGRSMDVKRESTE
jgi:hypothetical protein